MFYSFRQYAISFISFCMLIWGTEALAKSEDLHAKSQENIITLGPDQKVFKISVKAIPTTGYTWSVKTIDKTYLKFLGSNYVKNDNNKKLIGAPKDEIFNFEIIKKLKGPVFLTLRLARSWEPRDGMEKTYKITLRK